MGADVAAAVDGVGARAFGERAALDAFRRAFPAYAATAHLDELRAHEYGRLDANGEVYLDYTGAGLYAESQLFEHFALLRRRVLGNPHSAHPASLAATELVESARRAVLRYFNAPPEEYGVVFTANATGALKLVAEAYPFRAGDRFVLTFDNHNSVNGIREFARARGATTTYVPTTPPDLRVDERLLRLSLKRATPRANNLFAFPAQSNFSGVQHPLEWIAEAQAAGWDVLLDAAAFVPTNRLDLSVWHPDFVVMSFYKIFGYPTGVGCLIARRDALAKLHRPWFSGGTILAVSVQGDWYWPAGDESGFEDGTLDYLALPAVENGLRHVEHVGIDTIHVRVECLTAWLLAELAALRHSNGRPVVEIYGPKTGERRGATIALNFLTPDGHVVDERAVDRLAAEHRICVRTGCFCNPGAGEIAFSITPSQLAELEAEGGRTMDDFIAALGIESGGAVRVSLGLATTFGDVYRFAAFAAEFRDHAPAVADLPPRLRC